MEPADLGLPADLRDPVEIGRGGFGVVYRAMQVGLGREVAVKVMTAGALEGDALRRFEREALALGRVSEHPHIVTVHSTATTTTGLPFIVMAYMRGGSVKDLLADSGPLSWERVVNIGIQMCGALETAHRQGILHRDIKPGNVLLTDYGEPALGDFGIASLQGGPATQTGSFSGTLTYAAPELLDGERASVASEVYSLAATLFAMLTGRAPFGEDGSSLPALLSAVLTGSPATMHPTQVPPVLQQVVLRGLARNPADRYANARDLGFALADAATALGVQPPSMVVLSLPDPRPASSGSDARGPSPAPTGGPAPSLQLPPGHPPPAQRAEVQEPAPPRPDVTVVGADHAPAGVTRAKVEETTTLQLGRVIDLGADGEPAIDGFALLSRVATGRTGTLFKAYDEVRDTIVGLKVISREHTRQRARVLRGTSIWLGLNHPNVLRVFFLSQGSPEREGFVLMEWVDGVPLDELASTRPLDVEVVAELGVQLCDGLQHLHDHGLVHREVTPHNIMVNPTTLRLKLLDSGIARPILREQGAALTVAGERLTHVRHTPPEQLEGRTDPRSDLFAVGVLLYDLVTRPEDRAATAPLMQSQVADRTDLPHQLTGLLVSLLAAQPQDRPPSAAEVSSRLRQLLPSPRSSMDHSRVVVSMHGIQTHASWQRAFADVALDHGLAPRQERWHFGYFNLVRFLSPWARSSKVRWFRMIYNDEFGELRSLGVGAGRPSIVAHSFGTYILGNALQRYPYVEFGKVILTGSILPRDFDWATILDRGQVEEVRNEYGARDIWTRLVELMVPGTGQSGLRGFASAHPRLHQECFDFAHSEYFERGHMEANWIPFLRRPPTDDGRDTTVPGGRVRSLPPLGLIAIYLLLLAGLAWTITRLA